MQKHDGLARRAGASRQPQEIQRTTDLLDENGEDGHGRIVDQEIDAILRGDDRLVAGGNGMGNGRAASLQGVAYVALHGAALRDDADAGALRLVRLDRLEGQRRAVGVIHEADAVGADDGEAGGSGDGGKFLLRLLAGFILFAEARREDNHAAHAAARAGLDGFANDGRRHDEHRRVAARGQLVDAGDAGLPVDLAALAADEMKRPGEPEALDVGERVGADRERLGRRADDGARGWPDQPGQRRPRGFGCGHARLNPACRRRGPDDRTSRRGTATCP